MNNVERLMEAEQVFAKVYVAEKARLLDVLHDGDATLWEIAHRGCTKTEDRSSVRLLGRLKE